MKAIPEVIKIASRSLRKNMTQSEEKLWDKLKARKLNGIKFWRQNPTYVYTENSWLERYVIPDFLCSEHKIIIELDWNIHDKKDIFLLDLEKEKLLLNLWYKVIRFKNEEIFQNLESVLQKISTLCSCKDKWKKERIHRDYFKVNSLQ